MIETKLAGNVGLYLCKEKPLKNFGDIIQVRPTDRSDIFRHRPGFFRKRSNRGVLKIGGKTSALREG